MNYRLSVCIPTYNRAAYIGEAIRSIIKEVGSRDIEIVISDNASIDGTEEIVRSWQKKAPNIKYFRWDTNMGADHNYLKVVEIARGEYCWFLGSDDALKLGALSVVLGELESSHDIYLCNRTECDIYLTPVKDRAWLSHRTEGTEFVLSQRAEQLRYFKASQSLGAIFSYLSSVIFRKDKWNTVIYDEVFTGTAYSHAFMLLSFFHENCRLKYIKEPLVLCRCGNDSFAEAGVIRRFLLDFDGYLLLAEKCFHRDEMVKTEFLAVMTREHKWWYGLVKMRCFVPDTAAWADIEGRLRKFGYHSLGLWLLRTIGLLRGLLVKLVHLKRRLRII